MNLKIYSITRLNSLAGNRAGSKLDDQPLPIAHHNISAYVCDRHIYVHLDYSRPIS
jgi:hypothetical protein